MTIRSRSSRLCEDALTLAERGYSVFPCKERGKAPLTANGFKAATRDERTILGWWDRWPAANVAVACEASGVTVVDIDTKAGADPGVIISELVTLSGPGGDAVISTTGEAPEPCDEYPDALSGELGAHVWYSGLTRTGVTYWRGVELRSRGAYVIAPGSAHSSGVAYSWGSRSGPMRAGDLPELPEDLQAGGAANGEAKDWGAPPPADTVLTVSNRHDGLAFLAGTLIARRVFEPDLITGALLEANRVRCQPPKGEGEVRAIAKWAAESEAATAGRVEQELARRLFEAWRAEDGQAPS
jgi:hypothetical protein